MSDNPYESPRTDLTPPGLRKRRWSWLQDRLALFGTAIGITFLMGGSVVAATELQVPDEYVGVIPIGIFVCAIVISIRRQLRR